jgi:hypothetical protein
MMMMIIIIYSKSLLLHRHIIELFPTFSLSTTCPGQKNQTALLVNLHSRKIIYHSLLLLTNVVCFTAPSSFLFFVSVSVISHIKFESNSC